MIILIVKKKKKQDDQRATTCPVQNITKAQIRCQYEIQLGQQRLIIAAFSSEFAQKVLN